jgi:hypothetical protein
MFSDFHYLMEDGRTSCVKPICSIDADLKRRQGVSSNREYREALVKNTEEIIKRNSLTQSIFSLSNLNQNIVSTAGDYPFNYAPTSQVPVQREPTQPTRYEMSDMKQVYMSRQELQARMELPFFSQFELLNYGRSN